MKMTFSLDKFLKNLPEEQASAVFAATEGKEKLVVQRKVSIYEEDEDEDDEEEEYMSAGYISTPQVDRDQEIVLSSGMDVEMFMKNPVLLYNHKWADPPIGSNSEVRLTDKGIHAKQKYASTPFARDIYTLVKEKHLRTFSIGFIPLERHYKGDEGFQDAMEKAVQQYPWIKGAEKARSITTKSLLLENSVVNIPANTGAEILVVGKSLNLDPETIKALNIKIQTPQVIVPKIRLISRAKEVDVAAMVEKQISLMKGGI